MKKIFSLLFFLLLFTFTLKSHAATFTVDTTSDTNDANPGDGTCADINGECSLRAAIEESNALGGSNTITIPAGTYLITLGAVPFDITSSISFEGASASTVIIDANFNVSGAQRSFNIPASAMALTISFSGLTIQGGHGTTEGGSAIFEAAAAGAHVVTISNCIIQNNEDASSTASQGTVVFQQGTVTISNTTFSNNSVAGAGTGGSALTLLGTVVSTISASTFSGNTSTLSLGTLYYSSTGTLTLINLTFANNTGGAYYKTTTAASTLNNVTIANNTGVGVSNNGTGAITTSNSIYSNNSTSNCAGGALTSAGNNIDSNSKDCNFAGSGDLVATDPLLDSLANNGGPTFTMALQNTSPAIDAGSNVTCAATDQRGVTRPQGTSCDIGAFELVSGSLTVSPSSVSCGDQAINTNSSTHTVTVSNNTSSLILITSITNTGNFSQTNDCGTSLSANTSCTILLTCRPTTVGSNTGTLSIVNTGNSGTVSVPLTVTGISVVQQGGSLFGCGMISQNEKGNLFWNSLFLLFPFLFLGWKRAHTKIFPLHQ